MLIQFVGSSIQIKLDRTYPLQVIALKVRLLVVSFERIVISVFLVSAISLLYRFQHKLEVNIQGFENSSLSYQAAPQWHIHYSKV